MTKILVFIALGYLALLVLFMAVVKAAPPHYSDCHHNARSELVCRPCWAEDGKKRCGQPRIVREPANEWRRA